MDYSDSSEFQVTEIVSTGAVLHLANSDNAVSQRKALCIIGIAILHILAGGVDQFISNVVHGEGYAHQVLNNINNTPTSRESGKAISSQ